ncbi:MAG: hypothetical protein A3K23_00905 [Desulfobacca sp. RBG_16_58_9]|nr:MAG: hypothetical protein A3K23_00905 [Desulfobacca sp. RBG_16_58_9]
MLVAVLLVVAACAPQVPPPPPTNKIPSKVISEGGMRFLVYGLKFPGTSQDFKMREGEALFWLPLSIVQGVRLSGPELDNYRQAEVVLTSGERFRGELFVGQLIEGTTDVGYWNLSLKEVRSLVMGEE